MTKYKVKPTDGSPEFDIEADKVETSETSGAITFKRNDDSIVARQLNVSFREVQTPTE